MGKRHRDGDEPAVRVHNEVDGTVRLEYWNQGMLHRARGPAIIEVAEIAKDEWTTIREEYYVNGIEVNDAPEAPNLA